MCTVCGAITDPTVLTIIERDNSGEIRSEQPFNLYSRYTIPECSHVPDGMELVYRKLNGGVFRAYNFRAADCRITRGVFAAYSYVRSESFRAGGGNVTVGAMIDAADKEIRLGWNRLSDRFSFDRFFDNEDDLFYDVDDTHTCVFSVEDGQSLTDGTNVYTGTLTSNQINSLKGKTLRPYIEHNYDEPEWVWSNEYREAVAVFRCRDCDKPIEVKAAVSCEDSGRNRISTAECVFYGDRYSVTQAFRIIFDVNTSVRGRGALSVDKDIAAVGETVTVNASPDGGCVLTALYYTDAQGGLTELGGSFEMPESDVTVTAVFSYPEETEYIDENGDTQTVAATVLTGDEAALFDGWYCVRGSVTYNSDVELFGGVKLILCDGASLGMGRYNTLSLGSSPIRADSGLKVFRAPGDEPVRLSARSINAEALELIGGNIELSYKANADNINVIDAELVAEKITANAELNICGGSVELADDSGWVLSCYGDMTVSGGYLTVESDSDTAVNCDGDLTVTDGALNITGRLSAFSEGACLTIAGGYLFLDGDIVAQDALLIGGNSDIDGNVLAYGDLTLGWTALFDMIKAESYTPYGAFGIAEGKKLTDGDNVYSGAYSFNDRDLFAGKRLTPSLTDWESVQYQIDTTDDGSGTLVYSPIPYCFKAQSSDNRKLVNVTRALYNYHLAAKAYFP